MLKKIVSLSVAVMLSFCVLYVDAAKHSDVLRVYKKVSRDPKFSEIFSVASEKFYEYNITDEYVETKMKEFISGVIDDAVEGKENGSINEENLSSEAKNVIIQHVFAMDNRLFSLMLDNLTDEELEEALNGDFPKRFSSLYNVLYKELRYILGFSKRGIDIIFDDMAGYEWSYEAVDTLFNEGIINGMSDFMYCPGENVTREQFVKLLCEAFNIEKGDEEFEFSDVKVDSWYYPYIERMASNALINGMGDGKFGVGKNITRQDMAVMMYRVGEALGYFSAMPPQLPFNDDSSISSYASDAVNSLKANGIVNGDNENRFNPLNNASRAEAAQIIFNMYKIN